MGFFSSSKTVVVEYYNVTHIPLIPDTSNEAASDVVYRAVTESKDIVDELLYEAIFQNPRTAVNTFNRRLTTTSLLTPPTYKLALAQMHPDAIKKHLFDTHGIDAYIDDFYLGTIEPIDWINYFLWQYARMDLVTYLIAHSDSRIKDWTANVNDYTVNQDGTFTITVSKDGVTETFPYDIPALPENEHYVVFYHKVDAPSEIGIFIYDAIEGLIHDLNSVINQDDAVNFDRYVFPFIPLRLNNKAFKDFDTALKNEIDYVLAPLQLDANDIAENVLEEVLTNSEVTTNELDHIFLNFGINMWNTDQVSLKYLFNFASECYRTHIVNIAKYGEQYEGNKTYNDILFTGSHYEYNFQFNYVVRDFISLAEINNNPGSDAYNTYYSNQGYFEDGQLKEEYYTSSGAGSFPTGYIAYTADDVDAYLAGNGVPNPGDVDPAYADYLHILGDFNYTGEVFSPDYVYRNDNGSLIKETPSDAAADTTEITYYLISEEGLYSYTIAKPVAGFKVVDGATGHYKIVYNTLANRENILVPLILDKDPAGNTTIAITSADLRQLLLRSINVGIYIADWHTVKVKSGGFFSSFFSVVLVVASFFIPGLGGLGSLLSQGFTAAAVASFVQSVIINFVVQQIITYVAKEISPELALVLSVVWAGYNSGIDFSKPQFGLDLQDITKLFADISDAIGRITTITVDKDLTELAKDKREFLNAHNDQMDALRELQESLLRDTDGSALSLLTQQTRGFISPLDPEYYYATTIEYKHDLQYIDYANSTKIDLIYSYV